eukprot:9125046-Karenia_brevis.AAC.1
MQQRARHYRDYVDFATAARYITEDVAIGELGWKITQQHFRYSVREQRLAAREAASAAGSS